MLRLLAFIVLMSGCLATSVPPNKALNAQAAFDVRDATTWVFPQPGSYQFRVSFPLGGQLDLSLDLGRDRRLNLTDHVATMPKFDVGERFILTNQDLKMAPIGAPVLFWFAVWPAEDGERPRRAYSLQPIDKDGTLLIRVDTNLPSAAVTLGPPTVPGKNESIRLVPGAPVAALNVTQEHSPATLTRPASWRWHTKPVHMSAGDLVVGHAWALGTYGDAQVHQSRAVLDGRFVGGSCEGNQWQGQPRVGSRYDFLATGRYGLASIHFAPELRPGEQLCAFYEITHVGTGPPLNLVARYLQFPFVDS